MNKYNTRLKNVKRKKKELLEFREGSDYFWLGKFRKGFTHSVIHSFDKHMRQK